MLRVKLLCAGLAVALFGLALPGTAADPKEAAVKKELKALEGSWDVKTALRDGKEVPVPAETGAMLVLTDTKFSVKIGGKEDVSGTFTLDPSKTPKAIDAVADIGPTKGMKRLGIYEVKGDEAKMAIGDAGKDRPADFSGKGVTVYTYKRAK